MAYCEFVDDTGNVFIELQDGQTVVLSPAQYLKMKE